MNFNAVPLKTMCLIVLLWIFYAIPILQCLWLSSLLAILTDLYFHIFVAYRDALKPGLLHQAPALTIRSFWYCHQLLSYVFSFNISSVQQSVDFYYPVDRGVSYPSHHYLYLHSQHKDPYFVVFASVGCLCWTSLYCLHAGFSLYLPLSGFSLCLPPLGFSLYLPLSGFSLCLPPLGCFVMLSVGWLICSLVVL